VTFGEFVELGLKESHLVRTRKARALLVLSLTLQLLAILAVTVAVVAAIGAAAWGVHCLAGGRGLLGFATLALLVIGPGRYIWAGERSPKPIRNGLGPCELGSPHAQPATKPRAPSH
jgi:hypothetical protein